MQRKFVCSIWEFILYIIYIYMCDLHMNNAIAKIPKIDFLICTCDYSAQLIFVYTCQQALEPPRAALTESFA